jgi:hypothetical protein
MELFETAEYLGLDELKVQIVTDGVMKRPEFIKYTNVRRHYLENINEEALPYVCTHHPNQPFYRYLRACHHPCSYSP